MSQSSTPLPYAGSPREPGPRSGVVTLIGVTKLAEALLLFLLATSALKLLHKDVEETARHFIHQLHLDPDGKYLRALLSKLLSVDDRKLRELGVILYVYFALHLTEGVGLLMHKRWAEYFTVVTTSLLVPLEVYEICKKPTATKVIVLIANLAIVAYLIFRLWRTRKAERGPGGANA